LNFNCSRGIYQLSGDQESSASSAGCGSTWWLSGLAMMACTQHGGGINASIATLATFEETKVCETFAEPGSSMKIAPKTKLSTLLGSAAYKTAVHKAKNLKREWRECRVTQSHEPTSCDFDFCPESVVSLPGNLPSWPPWQQFIVTGVVAA
jgi:hypothetical protein